MEYTSFITLDDVKSKGYDLLKPGRLNQGDFTTIDEAAADFLQSCFDTVYDLIEADRGTQWTEGFFEDMAGTLTDSNALKMQKGLKKAILIQTIFIYENGDPNDSADTTVMRKGYSDKTLRLLYSNHII